MRPLADRYQTELEPDERRQDDDNPWMLGPERLEAFLRPRDAGQNFLFLFPNLVMCKGF
jgi:hypothetical protein